MEHSVADVFFFFRLNLAMESKVPIGPVRSRTWHSPSTGKVPPPTTKRPATTLGITHSPAVASKTIRQPITRPKSTAGTRDVVLIRSCLLDCSVTYMTQSHLGGGIIWPQPTPAYGTVHGLRQGLLYCEYSNCPSKTLWLYLWPHTVVFFIDYCANSIQHSSAVQDLRLLVSLHLNQE